MFVRFQATERASAMIQDAENSTGARSRKIHSALDCLFTLREN
jgi:hypothetical protein